MQILSNKLWYSLILSSVFFLNSCANYYYVPNDSNLLAISEPGELKVSGSISPVINDKTIDNAKIYGFQAGYSPMKHLVVNVNYFSAEMAKSPVLNIFTNSSSYLSGSGSIFEGAVGGYLNNKKLASSSRYRKSFLDAYIGTGKGSILNYYPSGGQMSLDFRKVYLQVGVHAKWNLEKVMLSSSLALRGSQLDFEKANINGILDFNTTEQISYLAQNEPVRFLEASYRFNMGWRHFSLFFSGTLARSKIELEYLSSIAKVGAVVNIDEFFKQKVFIRFKKKEAINDNL